MTDRHSGYLVVLDQDIREDDAEATLTALRMVRGVLSVEPVVSDIQQVIAERRLTGRIASSLLQWMRENLR